jgi:hypothetical protein
MTWLRSVSPRWSCLARALPRMTGFTASRCEGFGDSERWITLPSNSRSAEAPRWYFTSPEPRISSGCEERPWNSENSAV